jgi:uncharacterized membrane protein
MAKNLSREYASTSGSSSEGLENLRRHSDEPAGMGKTGRLVAGVAGAALLVLSLRRKRLRPVLLPIATGLISRAITGNPTVSLEKPGKGSRKRRTSPVASVRRGQGIKVEDSVIINRPVLEVYRFWRNFENLPRFMDHLESVTVIDENTSHWVAKGPAGTRIEWDAVIHNEIDDELIAWRTLPGAEVSSAGSVHFTPAAGGATEVRVVLSYEPPAGWLGAAVAKLLGEEPSQQVEDDLRRLKQVMDAGETAAAPRHSTTRA